MPVWQGKTTLRLLDENSTPIAELTLSGCAHKQHCRMPFLTHGQAQP
jgi:hypothetical protein